jgi:Ca2+/Na+ antiporter
MLQEFLRSLGVANFLLLVGTCLTILLVGLAYWFPRFVAWLLTACFAILVLVTYEITEQADQDFQKTKLIADVDGSLPTPGCPSERPIGLNIRNLGERTVTSMNWRLLVTRRIKSSSTGGCLQSGFGVISRMSRPITS